jgi:hypothetical protein
VLVLLGCLDLATRATAINTQPTLGRSVFQRGSLGESSETMQEFSSRPAHVSATQSERVPLPTRKPQRLYKVRTEKEVNAVTQKRMAQQKSARKRMR